MRSLNFFVILLFAIYSAPSIPSYQWKGEHKTLNNVLADYVAVKEVYKCVLSVYTHAL